MISFFSRSKLPTCIPDSRSCPRNFRVAAFLPNPAPPVINFRFEKKWEPINTNAKVTKPRFNPFNLAETGEIIIPTKAAANPDNGSQIIISSSYPITLDVATPPIIAETYVPIPTKTP